MVERKGSRRKTAPRKGPKAPARKEAPPSPKRKAVVAKEAPPALPEAVLRQRPAGLHELAPAPGAVRSRRRVGRGPGSGHGKTAGRGSKGQKSRSGYRHQRGFEGGQMPFHRRVPKRGFTNIFRIAYDVVNLSDLDRFEAGEAVTPEILREKRLAGKTRPIKILGGGEIRKPLRISAHKFSASARLRIEAAGGSCEVLSR